METKEENRLRLGYSLSIPRRKTNLDRRAGWLTWAFSIEWKALLIEMGSFPC